jgi:sodium-dependent dicarboxylate transporter 2/3/5
MTASSREVSRVLSDPPTPHLTTRPDRKFLILLAATALLFAIYLLPAPAPLERAGNLIPLTPAGKACLGIMAFAVTLWVTETIPFAATSLLVVLLIPAFGIANYRDVVRAGFGDPVITFFIGVLMLSAAFTLSGLGTRLTYHVLLSVGTRTDRVLLAVLVVGTLISMWITDMAVAAMLLPLGVGLLHDAGLRPGQSNFGRALMIATAFGPLIGGIATPAGTAANIVAVGQLKQLAGADVSFWRWMTLGVPASLLMIPFAWWILRWLFPPEIDRLPITTDAIRARLHALGPLRGAETRTVLVFAAVVACWLLTPLPIEAVGLAGGVALFLPGMRVLTWKEAEAHVEWGGLMMIVAGLSLGLAVYDSGAARWLAWVLLGQITSVPSVLRPFVIVLAVAALHLLFSSNTVTASIIVPILVALATDLRLDAWTTVAPAAFTSSLAFVLVSEGPTTIIPYSSGYFSIRDMAKAGLLMTVAAAACVAVTQSAAGALSLDLRAVHDAPRPGIKRIAAVHDAAVVPQHEIAGTPMVTPGQAIGRRDFPDAIQQRVGFLERKPLEPGIAAASEIQMSAPAFRMHADERMEHARSGARIVGRRDARANIAAAVIGPVMLDAQGDCTSTEMLGQRIPRAVHGAEIRVATLRGDLERIECARLRRVRQVRHIRVPDRLAGAEAANGHTVLHDIGDDVDLWMPVHKSTAVLLNRRVIERSEATAEGNEVGIGERLIPEQHDGVIEPRFVNRPEDGVVDRREIHPSYFGAEGGSGGDDVKSSDGHDQNGKIAWHDGLSVQSGNGAYRLDVGAVLQGDAHVSLDDPPKDVDPFSVRKARLVLGGDAGKYFDYRFVPDFGGGHAVLLDAYIDARLSRSLRIRAGKDKTPVGYELLIGDTTLLFLERSIASSLVPNRDLGVQAQGEVVRGRVLYSAGVFNAVPDGRNSGHGIDDTGTDAAARIVLQMPSGLGFHLGGSRGQHDRVTPAVFYYHGRAGAFAEFVHSSGSAWDVTGSYVLTGEATSERGVRPGNDFDPRAGRWGALQLVARYGELTVNDRASHQFTVGVNWYPVNIVKYYVNFERTTSAGNMLAIRTQVAF